MTLREEAMEKISARLREYMDALKEGAHDDTEEKELFEDFAEDVLEIGANYQTAVNKLLDY